MNTNIKKLTNISLSADILKLIASIVMLIDHAAYCILHYYMVTCYMDILPQTYTKLNNVYEACRGIGRLAFPIFCFFLVEGFLRTRNIQKHIVRLAIFAILSEVPFDLAHFRVPLEWTHQNVILELLIGFLMLVLIRYIENIPGLSNGVRWTCIICSVIAFADISHLCHTDYNVKGIALIAVLYLFKKYGAFAHIAGAAAISFEKYAPFSFVLLYFYNPEIKPKLKYFFYFFYPVHLLLIYLIGYVLFQ